VLGWRTRAFSERATNDMLEETKAEARNRGLQLQIVSVQNPGELDGDFSELVRQRVDAVIVFPSAMLFFERRRIVELIAAHRLPAI
jgi:putative ABC transport system substrate-binding protein